MFVNRLHLIFDDWLPSANASPSTGKELENSWQFTWNVLGKHWECTGKVLDLSQISFICLIT